MEFVNVEEEEELIDNIVVKKHVGPKAAPQLHSFLDGFRDLVHRRDVFFGYSQSEVEKLIGGVSLLDVCVFLFSISEKHTN